MTEEHARITLSFDFISRPAFDEPPQLTRASAVQHYSVNCCFLDKRCYYAAAPAR